MSALKEKQPSLSPASTDYKKTPSNQNSLLDIS